MNACVERLRCRWLVLGLVLALTGCGEQLQEYRSEEGGFRILLPGEPSVPDDVPPGSHKIRLMQRSGSYAVAWTDLAPAPEQSSEERLSRACDSALASLKATLLSRRSFLLAGQYPACDFIVELSERGNRLHGRMILVDNRLYHVMVSGERWWIQQPVTQRVLDSFAVLD
jgi:hypothetical protein